MSIETSIGLETGQPYPYQRVELVEPDWTRFPGWKDVTPPTGPRCSGSARTASRTSGSCAS